MKKYPKSNREKQKHNHREHREIPWKVAEFQISSISFVSRCAWFWSRYPTLINVFDRYIENCNKLYNKYICMTAIACKTFKAQLNRI